MSDNLNVVTRLSFEMLTSWASVVPSPSCHCIAFDEVCISFVH